MRRSVLNRQRLVLASIADMTLHKRRRCRSIDDVIKMISVNNRKIVADEIIVEAVSHDFAGIYIRKRTSFERITKDHLFQHINIGSLIAGDNIDLLWPQFAPQPRRSPLLLPNEPPWPLGYIHSVRSACSDSCSLLGSTNLQSFGPLQGHHLSNSQQW